MIEILYRTKPIGCVHKLWPLIISAESPWDDFLDKYHRGVGSKQIIKHVHNADNVALSKVVSWPNLSYSNWQMNRTEQNRIFYFWLKLYKVFFVIWNIHKWKVANTSYLFLFQNNYAMVWTKSFHIWEKKSKAIRNLHLFKFKIKFPIR